MTLSIPIYSNQPLNKDAERIINKVLTAYPSQSIKFVDMTSTVDALTLPNNYSDSLMVFGTLPVGLNVTGMVVHTLSIAQLVTKANAISVLRAAINQFYLPQKAHPQVISWHNITILDPSKPVAIDIETSGDIRKQLPEEVDILSICFYQDGKWARWIPPAPGFFASRLHDVVKFLENAQFPIWHNGKFDIRVIQAKLDVRPHNAFDTMLAHHVLNQAAKDHKLKHLCRQYLGAPNWELGLNSYTKGGAYYENIPTNVLLEYNGWDVYWTYQLWLYLEPQIFSDDAFTSAFMLEMAASNFLLDIEQYGFAIDVAYAQQLEEDMSYAVSSSLDDLRTYVGDNTYNPNSWQQTRAIIEQYVVGYGGSTDEDSLLSLVEQLKSTSHPNGPWVTTFVDKLLTHRKLVKSLGTYVTGALKRQRQGRVHPTYLIHGTTTGRLSSKDPNIQNIPRDKKFRNIYVG